MEAMVTKLFIEEGVSTVKLINPVFSSESCMSTPMDAKTMAGNGC